MTKNNETSFYAVSELKQIGFKSFGNNIFISRNVKIYNPEKISLGNNIRIDDFCILSGGAGIDVGSYVHIGCFCALFGSSGIEMEDFSGLSSRVTIYSESDDYSGCSLTNPMIPEEFKPKKTKGKVILERHCIVGCGSTLLPKVKLREGVAVGAHSLVVKSCKEWSIYFGSPAKYLKPRKKDLLELEKSFLSI